MTPREIQEIHSKAAELIEKHGHCKGDLVDASGALCLIGAVKLAACGQVGGPTDEAFDDAIEVVRKKLDARGFPWKWISAWNDADDRNADEVVALLREELP